MKKFLAVLLSLLMIFAVLPFGALVASAEEKAVAFSLALNSATTAPLTRTNGTSTVKIDLKLDRNPDYLTGLAARVIIPAGVKLTSRTVNTNVTHGMVDMSQAPTPPKPITEKWLFMIRNTSAYDVETVWPVEEYGYEGNEIVDGTGVLVTMTFSVKWSDVEPGDLYFGLEEKDDGGATCCYTYDLDTNQVLNIDYTGDVSVTGLTIPVVDSNAPATPTVAEVTDTKVTLDTITGAQYKCGKEGAWQNSPVFEGLTAGTEYKFYASYPATPTSMSVVTVTTKHAAPTAKTVTDKTVELNAVDGAEYRLGDGAWQESPKFEGLSPAQTYTFQYRVGDAESLTAEIKTSKGTQQGPAWVSSDLNEIGDTYIVLNGRAGYEYTYALVNTLPGDAVWTKATEAGPLTIDGLTAETKYYFWLRASETETMNPSPSTRTTFTTIATASKQDQDPPEAPTAKVVTATSVTLNEIAGAWYRCDSGEWQNSPVFDNLDAGTNYTFYAKLAETDEFNESEPSAPAQITTSANAQDVQFEDMSVTLAGDLIANFGINFGEPAAAGSKVICSVDGKELTTDVDEGTTGYVPVLCNVNVLQMNKDITVTVMNGGETVAEMTTTVSDYLAAVKAAAEATGDADTVKKAVALANYGHYAQQMLNEQNELCIQDEDIMARLSDETFEAMSAEDITSTLVAKNDGAGVKIRKISMALDLEAKTSLVIYAYTDEELTSASVSDGKTATVEQMNYTNTLSGGPVNCYKILVKDIAANELATAYTVQFGSATVTLSALDYAKQVLAGNDDTAKLAMTALYNYYDANK